MSKKNSPLNNTLYYRIIFDDYNLDLSPSIIGFEKCSKNKGTINLKKSCYVLHFVLSGKGYISFNNGGDIEIGENTCFLIEPNCAASYYPDHDDPWSYFWIEMNGEMVTKLCYAASFKEHNMMLEINNMHAIRGIINRMFDEEAICPNQNGETLRISGLIYELFSLIISEHQRTDSIRQLSKKEEQVKLIIECINSNFTSPGLSVKKIADQFFFNPSYLTRMFKETTGVAPTKYINLLRMRRAVELLKMKNFSISQIAYALGYKNQFYFSREFKRHFGTSPSKYDL